jgi:hypothetical protein
MLDELRQQADQSEELDDEEEEASAYFRMRYQSDRPFMGMTAGQRLILAMMFLFMMFLLASFCLLITERIVPPAFF